MWKKRCDNELRGKEDGEKLRWCERRGKGEENKADMKERQRERDKGSEGVGSKRKRGSTEQSVKSVSGKVPQGWQLTNRVVLIHQSQKNTINLCKCVCLVYPMAGLYETGP